MTMLSGSNVPAVDALKDRFKELRKLHGLSQETLAERSGLERIEISNLETGRNQASSARVRQAIAKGFDLSVDDGIAFIEGAITAEEAFIRRAVDVQSAKGVRPFGEHPDWVQASREALEWTGYEPAVFQRVAQWSTPHMPRRLTRKFVARLAEAILELENEGLPPARTGQVARIDAMPRAKVKG